MTKVTIHQKLPSLNDYVNVCRADRFAAANYKKQIESDIAVDIADLPRFENPVHITFIWTEKNRRRDYDNIAFSKKFILDALVKCGKLRDDNRKHVVGFRDEFRLGDEYSCTLKIQEEGETDE